MQDFAANKSVRKKKKSSFLNKLLFPLIGISIFLLLIILLIRSIHFGDFFRNQERQVVLLVHKEVDKSAAYLLEANFTDLSLNVFPLNTETEINLGNYGQYRFQSVYPLLASVEQKPLNFVRSTYSFALGRVIDEVWAVDRAIELSDKKSNLKSIFFSKEVFQLPTTLVKKGSWLALIGDPRTEVVFFDIEEEFPMKTRRNVTDSSLFLCSIAIINTTSVNGLAGQIETVLSSDGFSVIRTDSDSQTLEDTEIVISSDETSQQNCKKVEEKIERLLPGEANHLTDDDVTKEYRADLVVKLGEDMKE